MGRRPARRWSMIFGAAVVSLIQANDGILYIHAGNSLWRSDGTNAGTQLLASPSNGINGSIVPSGTLVFFLGNDAAHRGRAVG